MDTYTSNAFLDSFFDDTRFLNDSEKLPDIIEDVNSDRFYKIFLKKYIEHCQQITSGRRDTIKQIMGKLNVDKSNCQRKIVSNIEAMIKLCNTELSDKEKKFLQWGMRESSEDYASVPNEETVKKWLAETDFRNPSRLYIYKIAFALGLKAFFPDKIMDTNTEYQTSVNFLFNKIYNQRYATRSADELIFIFCLNQGLNYLCAMQMLAKYKIICSETIFKNEDEIKNLLNDDHTLALINNSISDTPDDFVNFLIFLTPVLNDKHSSVLSQIEEYIEYFSVESKIKYYEAVHPEKENLCSNDVQVSQKNDNYKNKYIEKSYLNLGEKVLVSTILKKSFLFLDKRMTVSSAFKSHLTSDKEHSLQEFFSKHNLSKDLYEAMKNSAFQSVSENFGKYSQKCFSYIVNELIVTKDDVYNPDIIHRKVLSDGKYSYRIKKNPHNVSHNMIYRNLRNALITAHFFNYWSSTTSVLSEKGYISEINEILTDRYYLPLYSRNSFDSFFILCAKLYNKNINPIKGYYNIFNQIFNIYYEYNQFFLNHEKLTNEFQNYRPLDSQDFILSQDKSELCSNIDKNNIQKEILKILKP